jgi:DMSO reductase anchor subunit
MNKWTTTPKEFIALIVFVAWCLFCIAALDGFRHVGDVLRILGLK